MIPRRVSLRGFLCYREEQEIDFAGSTLWMLAGLNGSGKSAVFDAVTYALFGHHRGGSQHAAELVNKDADGLQVEFDFSLDDDLYRAKRTLRKTNRGTTSATQGIYRYQPPARGGRRLVAVNTLGGRGRAAVGFPQRPLGPVQVVVQGEVELDLEAIGVLVDQLGGVLRPAPVVAEQGVGDGVEDRRLAAAVEPGEHPQGRAGEVDLLLLAVAEEAAQAHSAGDHPRSPPMPCRAANPRPTPARRRGRRRGSSAIPPPGSRGRCPRSPSSGPPRRPSGPGRAYSVPSSRGSTSGGRSPPAPATP